MSRADFYLAFENRHRGSRELIRSRLEVYLPFVLPVMEHYPNAMALDLGCGRGEWVELLGSHGFCAQGVDADAAMVADCADRGLQVVQGDAIAHLAAQTTGSLAVVSAFHVVEHIGFEQLQRLVELARRCLLPGGLLVLETPNPENLTVGTSSFYLDPTHERPIPQELLSFLPEYHGYARQTVLRLQEAPALRATADQDIALATVLTGASPDYAVVAQTQGDDAVMRALDAPFAQVHGIGTLELALRYDRGVKARADALMAQLHEQHAADEQGAEEQRRHFIAQYDRLQTAMDGVLRHMDARFDAVAGQLRVLQTAVETLPPPPQPIPPDPELAILRAQLQHATADAHALRNSLSWRITAPLRVLARWVGFGKPTQHPKGRWSARAGAAVLGPVLRNHVLASRLNGQIQRVPALHRLLVRLAVHSGLMEAAPVDAPLQKQPSAPVSQADLPRTAREILGLLDQMGRRP